MSDHSIRACIIAFMDYRFQETIQSWLERNNYLGHSDEIMIAGSVRDIAKPIKATHKEALLREINLSVKLHNPQEFIIFEHQDCGGYAQDSTIPKSLDLKSDMQLHKNYAAKAVNMLKTLYPKIKTTLYYISLENKIYQL